MSAAYDRSKRLFDVVFSAVGLVVTSPLQLLIGVLIRFRLGAPVLFRQDRPGKDERIFRLVKFRTMVEPDPAAGLVTDEQRMTAIGCFLRSSSLDELPTLWNVLRGDMSFVGPRPLLVRYLARYSADQRRRHEVRPGVTGLAQVSGRNAISWNDRLIKDIEYMDRRSFALDMKILVSTAAQVIRREGISDGQGPTMTEFRPPPQPVASELENVAAR